MLRLAREYFGLAPGAGLTLRAESAERFLSRKRSRRSFDALVLDATEAPKTIEAPTATEAPTAIEAPTAVEAPRSKWRAEQGSSIRTNLGRLLSRDRCIVSPPRSLCTPDALERMRGALAGAGAVMIVNCCAARRPPRRQLRKRRQPACERQRHALSDATVDAVEHVAGDAAGYAAGDAAGDAADDGSMMGHQGEEWRQLKKSFARTFKRCGGEAHALCTSEGNVVLVGREAVDPSGIEALLPSPQPEAWLTACTSLGLIPETIT